MHIFVSSKCETNGTDKTRMWYSSGAASKALRILSSEVRNVDVRSE